MQEIGLANPNSTRGRCGCPGWLGDGGFVGINSGFNRADGCGVGRGSQRGGFGLKMSQMDILTTRGMVKSATPRLAVCVRHLPGFSNHYAVHSLAGAERSASTKTQGPAIPARSCPT